MQEGEGTKGGLAQQQLGLFPLPIRFKAHLRVGVCSADSSEQRELLEVRNLFGPRQQ